MFAFRSKMGLCEELAAATGTNWWDGWRTGALKKYYCVNITPLIYGLKYTCKQLHRSLICHEYQSVDWNSSGLLTVLKGHWKILLLKRRAEMFTHTLAGSHPEFYIFRAVESHTLTCCLAAQHSLLVLYGLAEILHPHPCLPHGKKEPRGCPSALSKLFSASQLHAIDSSSVW